MECFMDEVAKAAGKDPLEFRRALMKAYPKHLGVLNAAAEKGDWGKPLPPGVHRGIAQFMGYGSYSAAVAEVSVSSEGKLKIHRMVLALNCGHAVNPDQIAAQAEGSVVYGLSAALYGECTVQNGRMVELNFHTYPLLRLAEMPEVQTGIVPTPDIWGGGGGLVDGGCAPVRHGEIDAGEGRRDVKGNAVALGQHGKRISADLVGHVPVRGDAVCADQHEVDFSEAHQMPGRVVCDEGDGNLLPDHFPGGEARALEIGAGLARDHRDALALVACRAD